MTFFTGINLAARTRTLAALILATLAAGAYAVGDASTSFQIFVPPNNDNVGRDVALVVTNTSPYEANVNIVDDGADGDTDDSAVKKLARGQSYVAYIKNGTVNDDAGGKQDGDYFLVTSDQPVVVQMATNSDWQWDFVPAENKTMRGQSFFIYSPPTTFSQRDVNLVAYEDDTEVFVLDITTTPSTTTGTTSVSLDAPKEVLKTTLNAGEDLIGRKNLGIDILDPGRTYWIRSSKGVTCQYGSLVGNGRDGGGFVPSKNGFASGEEFYFFIPEDSSDEREVRIVSFNDANAVQFAGWNSAQRRWDSIGNYNLNRFGHADWVENGTNYAVYRLLCTPGKKVSVFTASWLEAKGLSGTKDIASFASSESGYGAGKEFLVYVPQPGTENNVKIDGKAIGNAGHLYLFGHVNNTTYEVVDADTQGTLYKRTGTIQKDKYVDVRMSDAEFTALNKPAQGKRPYLKVTTNHLITTMVSNHNDNWMTFVPSAVLPNPVLTAKSSVDVATVGSEGCVNFVADNKGAGELAQTKLELPLDPAVTYLSSSLSIAGLGEPVITTPVANGGQVLTWQGFKVPANGKLTGTVCFRVNARRPDNSVVRNRDFLSFPVLVRGVGFGIPIDQGGESETFTAQATAVLTVNNNSQTNITGFAATPIGASVHVTWQTGREPDLKGFKVYRSTSGDGPFTLITPRLVQGTGDATTGARYLTVDVPGNSSTLYYYRLELIDIANASSFHGPVSVLAEDRIAPPAPVITRAIPGDATVELEVTGSNQDGDLKGYQIYRADTANGNYVRLNPVLVNSGALYTDSTANNGRRYFYKARAVDTNGNTSEFSATVEVVMPSSLSASWTLAYEDQVGPGKNDWDYNDWVVLVDSQESFAQGGVSALDVRLEGVARGANYDNAFRLRVKGNGAWTAKVDIFANRDAATPRETHLSSGSGNVDLPLLANTRDALPVPEGFNFTNTLNRQSVAVLGSVARVRIDFADPTANPSNLRHRPPFDPYLRGPNGDIHQVREGFAASTEVVSFWPGSPLLGFNLDYVLAIENGTPANRKVVVAEAPGWRWPLENQKVWDAYPTVFASYMLSGRQLNTDWHLPSHRVAAKTYNWFPYTAAAKSTTALATSLEADFATTPTMSFGATFVASPKSFAYLSGSALDDTLVLAGSDGKVRLVDAAGTARDGWPITANSYRSTPAIGRLHADDANPVLITAEETYDNKAQLIAWELNPTPVQRWAATVGAAVKAPPAIADLDGDGSAEVLAITTAGSLVVLRADGTSAINAPVLTGEGEWNDKNILVSGGPVVADMDGDGKLEVFVVTPSGTRVHGFDSALHPLAGWPVNAGSAIVGGLAVAKFGPRGELAVVAASFDGQVHAWDGLGRSHDGFPVALGSPVTAPTVAFQDKLSGFDYIAVGTADGKVHLLGTDGVEKRGWPLEAGGEIFASPVVGDLDGDAEPEVLVAAANGRVSAWKLDGTAAEEFTFLVVGAVQATPLLADLDNDARTEVYVATALGDVVVVEGSAQTPLPLAEALVWPSVTGRSAANAAGTTLTFDNGPLPNRTPADIRNVLTETEPLPADGTGLDANGDGVVDAADVVSASR